MTTFRKSRVTFCVFLVVLMIFGWYGRPHGEWPMPKQQALVPEAIKEPAATRDVMESFSICNENECQPPGD